MKPNNPKKEIESDFVKSMAKDVIYTYKHLEPFSKIDPTDIIFIRDENIKQTFKKDIEIYPNDSVSLSQTGTCYVVLISTAFDSLTKNEQYRKVFHCLCHIPSNYKEEVKKTFKVPFVPHDFEMFELEATFINDVKKLEAERDKKDMQKDLRRSPIPYK